MAVGAEGSGRLLDGAFEMRAGAVIQRMRHGDRWMDPLDAELFQRNGAHEWRSEGEGSDGRAYVVDEAGQSQRHGAGRAAYLLLRLDQERGATGANHLNGRGQTVWSGADDHSVVLRAPHVAFAGVTTRP